jgi:putative aldouronate transport system permease protein
VWISADIPHAFLVSVSRTVLVTILQVFITAMLAYTLSRKEFIFRKLFTYIVIISMYVNAGLFPGYFLIRSLGLINSFWVYIVPGLMGAFNFIVIRTYIRTIPESIAESAKMDGAGDFKIFISLIIPLITPVLATVALFVAVAAWNSWFDTVLYASQRPKLFTLQYQLMALLQSSMNQSRSMADINSAAQGANAAGSMVTPVSIRAAITVIAATPILVIYPFLQRYFVVGLSVGSVTE